MERLNSVKVQFKDFSGQDLKKKDLSHSHFLYCNFDNCDMEYAVARHTVFSGSTFRKTNCRYTDFAFSKLSNTVFEPLDAYGATFTMECATFKGMKVSRQWWYCFMNFGLLMEPEKEKGKDPRDLAIELFGKERYLRLSRMFSRRGV